MMLFKSFPERSYFLFYTPHTVIKRPLCYFIATWTKTIHYSLKVLPIARTTQIISITFLKLTLLTFQLDAFSLIRLHRSCVSILATIYSIIPLTFLNFPFQSSTSTSGSIGHPSSAHCHTHR